AEDALEDRPDQGGVRAAENDRVDARLLQRRGVFAHRIGRLHAEGIVALYQGNEPRARNLQELRAGIERVHELAVAAGLHRPLGREQADPAVPRRLHGGVSLWGDHAHDRNVELFLQLRQGRGRGRVACVDDELYAALLQERADLAREPAYVGERLRAVREPRMVAEVDEVLVRHGYEALVQDGQAAHARVEDAHRPRIHAARC